MKLRLYIGGLIAFSVLFSSCGKDSEEGESFVPHAYNVSGKVEKGPFVSGSTITIQPMDSKLQVRGDFYSSTIQDDMGNFSFGSKLFESPYAELTANGYFFNEVEGELSSGTLSLRALVDLSDKTTVNVNVLAHLKYQRVQKLVEGGMSFKEANTQAQKELFTAFGLQKYEDKDASSLSIIGGADESAALIAISSLLIVDRSEAALTEYLAKLCKEFGDNGAFTESTRQQMEEDRNALAGQLSAVRNHVIDRYEEIGLPIEVKELTYFFDWDNDGVAGNETLQEGQTVTLETTELQVPNQGGNYTIKIISPVPVYLEPLISEDDESYPPLISDDYFSTNIYEGLADASVSLEKSLENNVLTINVSPLNSRTSKEASVKVYDCMGNEVGEVKIVQEGNPDMPLPKLGETGKTVVAGFALELAKAFSQWSLMEQYYHYNKEANLVSQYISPDATIISDIWNSFYRANRMNLMFKEAEAKQLGVYQSYFDVWNALYYYYMVVAWGDVPYVDSTDFGVAGGSSIFKTSQSEIFSRLIKELQEAMDNLEEKKNESLRDVNDFFFVSRDVARILLADIYMYQGNYLQAESLLAKVISGGFYMLDSSNYNQKETITDLYNNGSGTETILAVRNGVMTRSNISLGVPSLVPLMTYTDVLLSYAECLCKNGRTSDAEIQLNKLVTAKELQLSGVTVLDKIKSARLQLTLYCDVNFAFLKRIGLAKEVYGVENYRLLLPIPQRDVIAGGISQNTGY